MTRHRRIETRVTTWGRSSFVALAMVLVGSGASGCASGRTTFSSQANVAGTAPIKRLVVYEDAGATGLTAEMRMGLQKALANGFTACGITSTVLVASALELDPGQRIASAAKDFQTATVLQIVPAGGRLYGEDDSQLMFAFKLVDLESKQVAWLASAVFEVQHGGRPTDEVRSGERLGTSIVPRLRDDGVLADCPLVVAGWPSTPHPEPPPAKPSHLH